MKYEYLNGSEKDFEGAPEWAMFLSKDKFGDLAWDEGETNAPGLRYQWVDPENGRGVQKYAEGAIGVNLSGVIAERRPITEEADLNECIGQVCDALMGSVGKAESAGGGNAEGIYSFNMKGCEFIEDLVTFGKYDRQCKGVVIDVYDVLQAFGVVNPALQHLIKKALCAGLRGHKKREQDLVEILESAKRAIELEGK